MLFAAVAFIQNKKFFGSAPKDELKMIRVHKERFAGMHVLGYILGICAIVLIIGAVIFAVYNGIKSNYVFLQFFIRFLIMLDGYKIWDILFLDNYLLTKSNFFKHYYLEIEGCESLKKPDVIYMILRNRF